MLAFGANRRTFLWHKMTEVYVCDNNSLDQEFDPDICVCVCLRMCVCGEREQKSVVRWSNLESRRFRWTGNGGVFFFRTSSSKQFKYYLFRTIWLMARSRAVTGEPCKPVTNVIIDLVAAPTPVSFHSVNWDLLMCNNTQYSCVSQTTRPLTYYILLKYATGFFHLPSLIK